MKNVFFLTIMCFNLLCLFSRTTATSRYRFSFHHYNDIYSYSQAFSLPTKSTHLFSWNVDASQDANKNMTLAKEEDRYLVSFSMGIHPWHLASIRFTEKVSQNRIETKQLSSKISKNEFGIETPFQPLQSVILSPFFVSISDRYMKTPKDSLSISNPGIGRGVKAIFDIQNVTNIETELAFFNQEISSEKRGLIDASFDKLFKDIRLGGNFEGKNIVTHYPILNGREEKFLESARGDVYSDFSLYDKLITFIRYESSFQNDIYSLLEGFGGKHNNEEKTHHTIATTVSYRMSPRFTLDVSLEGYKGEKAYQDGINDEHSTVKTFTPAITVCPHRNSRMTLKHSIRLSSFSFPNPVTVTDRDILEKSILFTSSYALPRDTDLLLSLRRVENHTIYIRSELSANNVRRTSYAFETNVSHFANNVAKIEEQFAIVANYQLYDYLSQRSLFTRDFSHQSKLYLLFFKTVEPSAQYKFTKQDWGPYIYSYDSKEYIFYRNVENRKETFAFALEIKPLTLLSVTPSYTRINNRYRNFLETAAQTTTFIEEHYSTQLKYREREGKFIHFDITWVKRNVAKDFFEIKARISYAV
jgi:hypothetical protein